MKSFIKKLVRRNDISKPLITVSVSKSALKHNLNEFRRLAPEGQVAPVLKSNAYGHGLALVAGALKNEPVPFLVVDSHFEARVLRNEGITLPLLIIGYSTTETILKNQIIDVRFTLISIDSLEELAEKAEVPTTIHLKIDTGMHRQGIFPEEIEEALGIINKNKNIVLEGLCSHFADADSENRQFTESQIAKWNEAVKFTEESVPVLAYWHIAATSGHSFTNDISANLSRLGLGLFGIQHGAPSEPALSLKPVLEMTTIISGVKKINKGDFVGYGRTFAAPGKMTIATIPVGYYEGLDRRLSNKGVVKIGTVFAPIIGAISMNIAVIDVSHIQNVKRGDTVTVISARADDRNSVENIARDCQTIPYEILVHIPAHLKRVLVD